MSRPRIHPLLYRVLLVFAWLGLTAGLCEIAFRIAHAARPIYLFESSSYDRFRVAPGTLLYGHPVNPQGFLDAEHAFEKPADTRRVAVLGDSFVFGVVPYPDNFVTLLDDALPDVEVLNLGIAAIGLDQYPAVLANEALPRDPDLVIVCFFLGNDFFDYTSDLAVSHRGGASYLLTFLRYLFQIRPQMLGRSPDRAIYKDDSPTFKAEAYARILRRKSKLFRVDAPTFIPELQRAEQRFTEIAELCERSGTKLLVVLLPDEIQVDGAARRAMIEEIPGYRRRDYDYEQPNRAVLEILERQGIAALDLQPVFFEAGKAAKLYKPRDTHWNLAGNRLAADVLIAEIKRSRRNP